MYGFKDKIENSINLNNSIGYDSYSGTMYLKSDSGIKISKDYFDITQLSDDDYLVVNFVKINDEYEKRTGMITLTRDTDGDIIPFKEELTVPYTIENVEEFIKDYNGRKVR